MPPTTIIIATAFERIDWLIGRSLWSVYRQQGLDSRQAEVLIVDDHAAAEVLEQSQQAVMGLRQRLAMAGDEWPTRILRNRRTRFMSGTGAWNTGIEEAYRRHPEGWVSILDDDDAYLPHHLADCLGAIEHGTLAVFQRLEWLNEDGSRIPFPLSAAALMPERFFEGNPGVQGSNMFFKTQALMDIGGFDERLPNTTDRDLMIRFLWNLQRQHGQDLAQAGLIKILNEVGVLHYNHGREKVNNQLEQKQAGLERFYEHYRPFFSEEAYRLSLARARALFHYQPREEI